MFITFILFGGTGDLAYRKIYAALYEIFKNYSQIYLVVISVSRKKYTNKNFKEHIIEFDKNFLNDEGAEKFLKCIYYISLDLCNPENASILENHITQCEKEMHNKKAIRLFFFSIPPQIYEFALLLIENTSLTFQECEKRILIEKPFGLDYLSAVRVQKSIDKIFRTDEVYRIDHFLYKNITRSIINIRNEKSISNIWASHYIEKINIIYDEKEGILSRGYYYDEVGIIRDMFQNHLLQLFLLITINNFENSQVIKFEKIKILKNISNIVENNFFHNNILLGQYASNEKLELKGYLEEEKIPTDSITETFFSASFKFTNIFWENTEFHFRAAKGVLKSKGMVKIEFREHALTRIKMIYIYNDKVIYVYNNKRKHVFLRNEENVYEKIIIDSINKISDNFINYEEIKYCWKFVDKIYDYWRKNNCILTKYRRGEDTYNIDVF